MTTIAFPTNKVIDVAIRKIMWDVTRIIGARFAPVVERMAHIVEYDEILGPQGMTQLHGMDASAKLVKAPNVSHKTFSPGYFKEKMRVKESDLLRLRALGATEYQAMQAEQLIGEMMNTLNVRIEQRIEWLRWQAMIYGKIHINEEDMVLSVNYGIPSTNLDKRVSVSWITGPTTATGVNDLQNVQIAFRGTGYALKYVVLNSITAAKFIALDDTKKYYAGLTIREKLSIGSLPSFGASFMPGTEWLIYDGGYEAETTDGSRGAFVPYIPDNKIVFLGDAPVGEIIDFVTVPSLHSSTGRPTPGKFAFIIEKLGTTTDNPRVDLVGGIYGLPRIRRPEPIFVLDISKT